MRCLVGAAILCRKMSSSDNNKNKASVTTSWGWCWGPLFKRQIRFAAYFKLALFCLVKESRVAFSVPNLNQDQQLIFFHTHIQLNYSEATLVGQLFNNAHARRLPFYRIAPGTGFNESQPILYRFVPQHTVLGILYHGNHLRTAIYWIMPPTPPILPSTSCNSECSIRTSIAAAEKTLQSTQN